MGASHGLNYISYRRDSPCGCPQSAKVGSDSEPSVIFAEKEELYSERETAKGCCERYGANDDVVGRWLAAAV